MRVRKCARPAIKPKRKACKGDSSCRVLRSGTRANQTNQSNGLGAKEAVRRTPDNIANAIFPMGKEIISEAYGLWIL
jgi:hypothetical protein